MSALSLSLSSLFSTGAASRPNFLLRLASSVTVENSINTGFPGRISRGGIKVYMHIYMYENPMTTSLSSTIYTRCEEKKNGGAGVQWKWRAAS